MVTVVLIIQGLSKLLLTAQDDPARIVHVPFPVPHTRSVLAEGGPLAGSKTELGASEATVKMHRSQLMKKIQAKSLLELVRMANKLKSIT